MSNHPYQNVVPTKKNQLPHDHTYATTVMQTIAGPVQVANKSYDVQGQQVSSEHDTPLDVNALNGAVVTKSHLQVPSSGFIPGMGHHHQ
jgi:hypothetical protein